MNVSEEDVMNEINSILEDIAEQAHFENSMIVFEHMLLEKDEESQWWKTIGPGYDDDYNFEEWN